MIYDILPVNNYAGNNSSTVFDFDFYIENDKQLKVYLFDENDYKIELVYGVDYLINEFKNNNGSFITFPIENSNYGVLSDKQKISLELVLPISQDTKYNNSSRLNYGTLEYSFDYLTRLIQILSRKLSLCVKVEECSSKTPEELINEINDKSYQSVIAEAKASQALKEILVAKEDIDFNYDKFLQIDEIKNDVLNLIPSNSSLISSYPMISSKYISLEVGASRTQYTAPANGWFNAHIDYTTNTNNWVMLFNHTDDPKEWRPAISRESTTGTVAVLYPVKKGQTLELQYSTAGTIEETRKFMTFWYAEGEVEQCL